MKLKPTVKFCKTCTIPSCSAIPVEFDENGVCSGCNTANSSANIDWARRKRMFESLIEDLK